VIAVATVTSLPHRTPRKDPPPGGHDPVHPPLLLPPLVLHTEETPDAAGRLELFAHGAVVLQNLRLGGAIAHVVELALFVAALSEGEGVHAVEAAGLVESAEGIGVDPVPARRVVSIDEDDGGGGIFGEEGVHEGHAGGSSPDLRRTKDRESDTMSFRTIATSTFSDWRPRMNPKGTIGIYHEIVALQYFSSSRVIEVGQTADGVFPRWYAVLACVTRKLAGLDRDGECPSSDNIQ